MKKKTSQIYNPMYKKIIEIENASQEERSQMIKEILTLNEQIYKELMLFDKNSIIKKYD